MRLLYTDITNHLTQLLAKEAQTYADQGYRVFYIAPNSLSFEKERQVLESLPQRASFAITVTRFGQLARYLTLQDKHRPRLDDTGLSMVIYKVLSELADDDLNLYSLLRSDRSFIDQVLDFYKEWQSSDLTWEELDGIDSPKLADLRLILERVDAVLDGLELSTISPISQLRQDLAHQDLTGLDKTVIIVDGFTRFTAEEEGLLADLDAVCHEVVIAAYASQSSYQSSYTAGNLYQAAIEFLGHLATRFETTPSLITGVQEPRAFSRLTQKVDNRYAYRVDDTELRPDDVDKVQIWSVPTVKEELEQVAKAIRAKLHQGYRYKDMLVLLGDVATYELQLARVFDQYAIPFYLGKAEPMAEHPLVQVVDSLERLSRYQFRAEDLLNLVKSGLYGQFEPLDLDKFEQYVTYANTKGKAAFSRDFTKTNGQFDLPGLNGTRSAIMAPLTSFFKTKTATSSQWVAKLMALFETMGLRDQLQTMASQGSQLEAERHEEVWKTFVTLLEQLHLIFGETKLAVGDFLSILRSGMLSATYRVVPATVDVVKVKSYNLIEPHTNKVVFALGLTQSNFPEIVKNVSLLTDEDRQQINATLTESSLDLPSQDNLKRNNYVFASLLNAATELLVLSSPTLLGEAEDTMSHYLTELAELGLPIETKSSRQLTTSPDDLGTYRSLLARLVDAYRDNLLADLDEETADYWGVLVRRLRRKMAEQGLELPLVAAAAQSQAVSAEAMAARYPLDAPLRLSASSLTSFYNNEYLFFLTQVLRLQETVSSLPDARHHGIFFHRVFELVTADKSDHSFDDKLEQALATAKAEPDLAAIYDQSAETQYSQALLTDMVKTTAQLLTKTDGREILAEEIAFSDRLATLGGRNLTVVGKIDRLDRLVTSDSYGVVDYKSSDRAFDLAAVYNKLAPQLLTYLTHLTAEERAVFGAMYLHVHQPQLALSDLGNRADVLTETSKDLVYKGLFVKDKVGGLPATYKTSNTNTFTEEELAVLLAYNQQLYEAAAETILSGQFAINPYSSDGRSVDGDQLKAITRFEADLHLGQARHLTKFPRKDQKELIWAAIREQVEKKGDDHV